MTISFRNEGEMMFTDEGKLRESVATALALQDCSMVFFRQKGNDTRKKLGNSEIKEG